VITNGSRVLSLRFPWNGMGQSTIADAISRILPALRAAFEKHESEAEDRSSSGRVLPIVVASQVRGRALRPDALHRADVRSGASMALIRDGQQCVALGGIGRAKLMPQSLIERRRQ
jgi:hypothetical protein